MLVDVKWPPNKAPQERRSPVMMDRATKRCLELWGEASAEPLGKKAPSEPHPPADGS